MKKILFLGGGHANTLTIRNLIQKMIRNDVYDEIKKSFKFYLISEYDTSAYSGMIPGTICGYYSRDESFINLIEFSHIHNLEFIQKRVDALDPVNRKVFFHDNTELDYDILSINVGSTTYDCHQLEGASQYTIQTRPINKLLEKIENCEKKICDYYKFSDEKSTKSFSLGVIGGGVAGVELAFSLSYRFRSKYNLDCKAVVFSKGDNLIQDLEKNICEELFLLSEARKIQILKNSEVVEVNHNAVIYRNSEGLKQSMSFDLIVLATGAAPQQFNYQSKLSIDKRGFILVKNTLQSIDYPNIFGAGDCVQLEQFYTDDKIFPAKSGVYAVREASILTENLYAIIRNSNEFYEYTPQTSFLKLITMGDKMAFGTKFGIGFYGKWVWNMKEFIDVNFVQMFSKDPSCETTCVKDVIDTNVQFSFNPDDCYNKLINSSEEGDFTIQLKILDRLNSDSHLLEEIKNIFK
jgi:NADH dehydrogenase FAD-containing subunit